MKQQNPSAVQGFNARFKMMAILFIVVTGLSWYFTYQTEQFLLAVKVSSFALFGWTAWEHNLLLHREVYLKLFVLSAGLATAGYYFLLEETADVWLRATKMSLISLLLYLPLRYVYKSIYDREPKIEKTSGCTADRMYSFVLVVGTALLTMFI